MKTNIENVRRLAIAFLDEDIRETEFPFIIDHPIFENPHVLIPNGEMYNLLEEKDLRTVRGIYTDLINKSSVMEVYLLIRPPYKLAFVKYAKEYLSGKDFAELLADAWTMAENPNDDINVSLSEAVELFKAADKKYLMDKTEYAFYKKLPEVVTAYRGVGVGRNPKGLSWTLDYDKAEWFANRWGKKGYIQKAEVKKEYILAYFASRNEEEIVCETERLEINVE